ncbi:MAG TPA: hypothetical protein VHE37_16325, partial [Nevskiaceae bacterium]|nr:hypothetical protein [Nevskiaceae bacterium]
VRHMKPEQVETIALPNKAGTVRIEWYGEHHMGCANIAIVPPFPIAGIARFFTTNGSTYYSERTGSLVIRDTSVILKYSLKSHVLEHYVQPPGLYIYGLEEDDAGYNLRLYANFKETQKHIPFGSGEFKPGLGPVERGSFPNARFSF